MLTVDTLPDLNVCRVAVTDSQGTSTNSTVPPGSTTSCGYQRDEYINTVPVNVYFVITADLDLTASGSQSYIGRSPVGVIGIYVTVVKKSLSGKEINVDKLPLFKDLNFANIFLIYNSTKLIHL